MALEGATCRNDHGDPPRHGPSALHRTAYTAELSVRFRSAVVTGTPVKVRGWLERSHGRLHFAGAELTQSGEVKAVAHAKFLEPPGG